MDKTSKKALCFLIWLYFLLCYIANMLKVNGSRVGGIILIAVVFLIFAVYVVSSRGKIRVRITGFHVNILAIAIFCLLSSTWSSNKYWARNTGLDILEVLLAMSVIYICWHSEKNIDSLLKIVMYGSYAVVIYAFLFYGWRNMVAMLAASVRVSNDAINANRLGLCAAYAILINLYYVLYERFHIRDILMIPAILVLAVSGSRKALAVVIAGAFGIFILKNWDDRDKIRSFLRIILIVLLLAAFFAAMSRLPIFDEVNRRMMDLLNILLNRTAYTRSNSAWLRLEYNKLGWELFRSHPILGIGIGGANAYTIARYGHNHFLHNNYIELLACGGVVGCFIYYSIYLVILFRFVRYRRFRDKEYDITLILFLNTIVMDYGMVSYLDKSTYVFLFLFWIESEYLRRKGQGY